MSHLVASSAPVPGSHVVKRYPGFGILGANIPTTGDSGGSPAANDNLVADGEYYWRVETPPDSGVLEIFPDLTFTHTGATDGVHPWVYRLFETGVDQGTATVSDTFGDIAGSINLIIAEARHAHSADNLALTQAVALQIAEAIHAHYADTPILTSSTALAVAEALHAHHADVLVLNPSNFSASDLAFLLNYMEANLMIPTADENAAAVLAAFNGSVASKILRNKMITNPSTGQMTIYDDDGVTPLVSGQLFEDAAGMQPYRGKGAERRERLT